MIGLPLGLVYSNAMEWVIHKYLLHGRGKNKKSFWAFHWHDHHNSARKNNMVDAAYLEFPLSRGPQRKEIIALAAGAVVHLPLLPIAPWFVLGVCASAANYYRVHKKAHLDPQWAEEHLPWHVDHHMGANQHANWCVTYPLFDIIMGTREKYVGTQKHAEDKAREAARAAATNNSASDASSNDAEPARAAA